MLDTTNVVVRKINCCFRLKVNPFSANPTRWSNTLKQFVGKLPTNYLSVFDHFLGLALKGLSVKVVLIFTIIIIFCQLSTNISVCV